MNTGGIGSYMYHQAKLLSKAGHSVTVFSATLKEGSVKYEDTGYCINYVFHAPTLKDFREAVRDFFHTYIKTERVDIIESPEVGACALGIKEDYPEIPLMVRLHTPGVVITKVSNTHQPFLTKLRFVMGALRRGRLDLGYWSKTDKNRAADPEYKICLLADQLVSPSKALGDYLRRYWQLNKEIKIVPNPFHADADLFHFPIEGREKLICFVGKLTVLKGMFTLTEALKVILKQHPDFRIVFAGRDEVVSEIIPSMRAWMAAELKDVIDRVAFTGALNRQEVKALMGNSRVCVAPSLWENYPTVVLEAMAAGAAVAAASRGGIPEIIADGKTGYLFDPIRPADIVRAVKQLIAVDAESLRIADAARQWVSNSQPEVEQRILDLYQSLAKH
ncbi:glycosyltransferase family 4 protein [Aquiflexum sp. LQ15W]|uniref:glycosyltransferase family 4 protein n=1 Tax=Cognataquiflexum nitidum TaxID=2922272 RepID=UPI001F139DFA|nr:glycosyltransferase family 4 protein [Cognataquiflexum nitidum]MCH6201343.1 glycosyltransferase family 4 protein [Cognataquiflexum nitidum]